MKTETALTMPVAMPPMGQMEEDEGGLNFGALLKALQRKWWLIAGMTAATTTLAGAKVLTDTPTYSGLFEILVQAQSTETEVISDVPDTLTTRSKENVDGDLLKLLKSPSILQPVVDGMRQKDPTFCRSGAATRGEKANYDPCYDQLASRVSVGSADKNSQIIQASFQDLDPQTVRTALELLSQAYLDYSLASKQADIQRGVDFVNQKLPDLRGKVNELQDQMETLRADNNLIDPASRGSQLASQVSSFSNEQLAVQSQLREQRQLYAELQQQTGQSQEQASSSVLNQNPRYQSLLNSLLALDAQMAEASTIYLNNSPDMEVLLEQRDNLLRLLEQQGVQSQREVLNQIQELEGRDRSIGQTLQELNANVDDLSGISRDYSDITRELEIATNNLNQFLSKREALQIDAAQREVPWEIVTPPTTPRPQSESLPQNLLLGAVLGLMLGTGAALLLDRSTGVLYGDDEIRRSTQLPILARIPTNHVLNGGDIQERFAESLQYVGSNIKAGAAQDESASPSGKMVSNAYDSDPFSEAFRLLYTNLRQSNSGKRIRSIAVSSSTAGEGKSTVAIYLAEAAAAMGQRVLLVDADLRNPRIHQYLELPNEKGLTNLFSGAVNPAVIQKFSEDPSIYVMCSGSHPIEPSRVLGSGGMQKLVEKMKPVFDLIIFDTPPLLGQSDAYLVANHVDGLLLVAQSGRLKQPLLERAMEQLRLADVNVLGVVSRES